MIEIVFDCNKTMALITILFSPSLQRKIFSRNDVQDLDILTVTLVQIEMIIGFKSYFTIISGGKGIQFLSILFQTIDHKRDIGFVISQDFFCFPQPLSAPRLISSPFLLNNQFSRPS